MMRHSRVLTTLALLVLVAAGARAHDMFFRLTHYFVSPGDKVRAPLLNGTFSKSENSIVWDRITDLSVTSPAGRVKQDSAHWDTRTDTSWLSFTTGKAGTYLVGLSTGTKELDEKGKDFNEYLRTDGVPDVLAARTRAGELAKAVREKYSKHVKAVLQVGDARSGEWATVLGYPAELVPMTNPADLRKGDELALRCLVDGAPMPGQFVLYGGRGAGESRIEGRSARSGKDGVVRVKFDRPGVWYVKFIRMVPVHDGRVDYESKWATISFEVR
jgi:uncharacterized GH25 family protein